MPRTSLVLLLIALALGLQHPAAYFNSQETLIIAHRGASGFLPEHTLQAYSMEQLWAPTSSSPT